MSNNINWNSFKAVATGFVLGWQNNGLVDACRSLVICDSSDIAVTRTAGGTTLTIKKPPQVPATPLPLYPYEGTDVSTTSYAGVTVNFGTHNNFAPTIDGTALVAPVGGTPPVLELSTGTGYVYAQFSMSTDSQGNIILSDGEIDSTNTTVPANDVDPSGTGTIYQALFGFNASTITVDGVTKYQVAISPSIRTSMYVTQCGGALAFGVV